MTQFKVDFNDFKRRDNTNLMEITIYKDSGEQITPNRDHQWSGKAIKFGDGDKRLDQELAVTLDGDKIGVPSKQLENLPSGDYGLELWEVNNDSKTIYPSAGFIEFHIHRNADESLESVTPTIDIDKVIDDLHQAGLNVVVDGIEMLAPDATPSVTSEVHDGKNHIKLHVPRGLKGDIGPAPTLKIGTVTKLNSDQTPTANISGDNGVYTLDLGIPQGSQGETDATATQALNVANGVDSKVTAIQRNGGGRNLVAGTGTDIIIDATSPNAGNYMMARINFTEQPKQGDLITISADSTLTGTGALDEYEVILYDETVSQIRSSASPYLKAGKRDSVTLSLDKLNGSGDTILLIYAGKGGDTQGKKNVIHHLMVEKGTVAHDWSPAPEDAPSNDSQLVHKTNNETIAGDKAFVGNTTLATTKILAGNYGLRVTSSGFEKTTDGITWVPANI